MPALQRARRRLRPRRPPDPGRQGRRRVGGQRPEGVDLGRPGRRPRHAHRPHRRRRPEAPGHQLLRHRHAPGRGHRGAPAQGDDRPGPVQRGVPDRGPGRATTRSSAATTTAGRWPTPPSPSSGPASAPAAARPRPRRRRPGTIAGDLDKRAGDFVGPSPRGGGAGRHARRRRAAADRAGQGLGQARRPGRSARSSCGSTRSTSSPASPTCASKAEREAGREIPGAGNLAKLSMSRILRLSRELGLSILGGYGTLHAYGNDRKALDEATGNPFLAMVTEMALFSPGPSIYGGTDEVQRNIIGERVLGLPEGAGQRPHHAVPGAAEERLSRPSGAAGRSAAPERAPVPLGQRVVDDRLVLGVGDLRRQLLRAGQVGPGPVDVAGRQPCPRPHLVGERAGPSRPSRRARTRRARGSAGRGAGPARGGRWPGPPGRSGTRPGRGWRRCRPRSSGRWRRWRRRASAPGRRAASPSPAVSSRSHVSLLSSTPNQRCRSRSSTRRVPTSCTRSCHDPKPDSWAMVACASRRVKRAGSTGRSAYPGWEAATRASASGTRRDTARRSSLARVRSWPRSGWVGRGSGTA